MPFGRFSLIPSFAPYSGPYTVGTQEIEVPVNELSQDTGSSPEPSISTINFRVFYPCQEERRKHAPAYWLPSPQTEYFKGYAEFLNAKPWLATLLT